MTVVSAEKEETEKELLDFLNKAPIAMHWLSGTGHVLWANETEMNVLGYTPEEYIGQPIMKFCPDEEELVLEIFKTLGSGNAIKDVPVRFRSKSGGLKHLLIDSNVNWNADGSFRHTRCFIRDDTGRKVREARLEERHRNLLEMAKAKDKFMRKVFHEIKTPCHLLSSVLDCPDEEDPLSFIADAQHQARALRDLVDDAVDAALFDDGRVPVFTPAPFSLYQRVSDLCRGLEVELGGRSSLDVEHLLTFGISSGAQPAPEGGRRVLVVEGNAGQRMVFKSMLLKDVKCECTLAVDGAAALQALRGADFTVVILGGTAGSSQEELVRQIRQEQAAQGMQSSQFIAVVAADCADEALAAAGVARRLTKPVDRQLLKVAVEEALAPPSVSGLKASTGTWASGVDFCPQVPDLVEGDWRYLSRVLRHLLTNALKHTAAGRVELGLALELGRIRFSVTDTGHGVDADEVRSAFQRFWHLRAPVSPADAEEPRGAADGEPMSDLANDKDGLGLGLNVSFNIVQSMGGVLEVESHPGAPKTVFSFSVPLAVLPEQKPYARPAASAPAQVAQPVVEKCPALPAPVPAPEAAMVSPAPASTARRHDAGRVQRDFNDLFSCPTAWTDVANSAEAERHVALRAAGGDDEAEKRLPPAVGLAACTARNPHCLVVDDNAICQKVAKKMLESLGCTVELASNGLEAVMLIKEAPWSFDFVLMDLRMPVMDGIDATLQIRKELRLLSLPVVAFSAEVGSDVRELCRDARFDGFVAKPADKATLRAELDRLVVSDVGQGASDAFTSAAEAKAGGGSVQRQFDQLGVCGPDPAVDALPPSPLRAATASKGLPAVLRVLAVDDNAICLKVAKKMLEKLGCTVRLANNGLEAVNAIRAAPADFDFVLMDLRMPVMDGIEATVRIRKELGLTALPIVAFSAEVGQEVRDVCKESGFDGFLAKPADRDAIRAELERLAGASTRKAVAALPSRPAFLGAAAAEKPAAAEKAPAAGPGGFAGMMDGGSSFLSAFDFDTPRPNF